MGVYTLKHGTPKMKYQHMMMVLVWRADLKDVQANPPDRHVALEEIKQSMGAYEFEMWYGQVYQLRAADRNKEYEKKIFDKLEELHLSVAQTEAISNKT